MTQLGWILLGVGGAAAVGVGIYAATRPAAAPAPAPSAPAPTAPPAQTPNPITPSPITLPQTRYSMPFTPGKTIYLGVGDTILLTPPSAANPGQQWVFQGGSGLTAITWGPNTTPNTQTTYDYGIFTATSAGTWQITAEQFTPNAGGNTSPQTMTVVVQTPVTINQA